MVLFLEGEFTLQTTVTGVSRREGYDATRFVFKLYAVRFRVVSIVLFISLHCLRTRLRWWPQP